MKSETKQKVCGAILAGALAFHADSPESLGQEPMGPGSPSMTSMRQQPIWTMQNSSLLYRKVEPPRLLQVHDTLTAVISISSIMQSEGDTNSRKKASLGAILLDWVKLDLRGPSLRPDAQRQGDPTIAGEYESRFRAESELESLERLTLKLGVTIVEVLPNGILRIEGTREIAINEEQWLLHVSGEINRTDIDENKIITDDKIADLRVTKKEKGQVRDGVRRGWFTRFYDRFLPI